MSTEFEVFCAFVLDVTVDASDTHHVAFHWLATCEHDLRCSEWRGEWCAIVEFKYGFLDVVCTHVGGQEPGGCV